MTSDKYNTNVMVITDINMILWCNHVEEYSSISVSHDHLEEVDDTAEWNKHTAYWPMSDLW